MLVSRMTRINQCLQIFSGAISVTGFDLLHALVKHAPAYRFLDELGDIAFAHPLGAQVGTQRGIGFLGDGDGPTGGGISAHQGFLLGA